jgi:hypothetical protein
MSLISTCHNKAVRLWIEEDLLFAAKLIFAISYKRFFPCVSTALVCDLF